MTTRDDRVQRWADRLIPLIDYCESCQPHDPDTGKVIWVGGERTQVADFLAQHRVAERLQADVADRLACRECGRSEFDLWDEIGLEPADARMRRLAWQEWDRKHSAALADFARHLERFPYLGLRHVMGRRIFRAISKFPQTRLRQRGWWRARRPDGTRAFGPDDMHPPPPELARAEGRFNHFGQVTFYLASTPDAAVVETLDSPRHDGVGWVQKFHISTSTRVLDLVRRGTDEELDVPVLALGLISHLPSLQPDLESPWKPQYFIPRFIADCAKAHDIAGIVFSSDKHWQQNLALFHWNPSDVRPHRVPRLHRVYAHNSRNILYQDAQSDIESAF